MELKTLPTPPLPEWIPATVVKLQPLITPATQFVCKTEKLETFGDHDGSLSIQIGNSESVRTTRFFTDGTYDDIDTKHYNDGWVQQRKVRNWTWIFIENAVRGGTAGAKIVQTLYTRDKRLYLELRRSVGLPGY